MNWNQCFRIFRASFTCCGSSFLLFFVEYLWSTSCAPRVLLGTAGTYKANESTGSYGSLQKGHITLLEGQGGLLSGSYSESWDLNDNQAKIGWRKEEYRQQDQQVDRTMIQEVQRKKGTGERWTGRQALDLESRIKKQALSSSFL